ncbi:MAG: DUF6048 family protein [Paludibacteraceae bacterium]|nr:DUF6048 family protein [Paludibacteraceae bacterium]
MSTLRYICNILLILVSGVSLSYAANADSLRVSAPAAADSTIITPLDSAMVVPLDSALIMPLDSTKSVIVLDSAITVVTDSTSGYEQITNDVKVFQGVYLNVDIFSPIATAFNGGRFEFVVSSDVDLWHRLFPAVEFGMMFMNDNNDAYNYKSDGFFLKAGALYNFINNKPDRKYDHLFGVGFRYAYSNLNYTLSNAQLKETYWKEETTISNAKRNVNVGWLEFFVAVRVQVYKDFFMGLNLKIKTFPHLYKKSTDYPTYIPGFGEYSKSVTNFGFEYTLSYRFPTKKGTR